MDLVCMFFYICITVGLVQLLRLILSDCDLTLQWATKFGKPLASLKGKIIWVTGASSGIGEHLVYELAAVGCKLVLSARREQELQRVKKQCLLTGPLKDEDVLVVPLDMLKQDEHQAAVNTVMNHFKKVDILVNNAGRTQRANWVKTSLDVDREMMETNVMGYLSLTKLVLPDMIDRKDGHIVVMSSGAGKMGVPGSGSYTGAKHALQGWFDCLRVEEFANNIRVTLVCPGPVHSKLLGTAMTEKKGEVFGKDWSSTDKRMATQRCSYLTAVSIANEMDEVWVSPHPILFFMYLSQYFPSLTKRLACKLGLSQLKKMREGGDQ